MKTGKSCCPSSIPQKTRKQIPPNQELADFAKALGHPARIEILKILKSKKSCVCGEIVELLPLAQATVSQHLKVLKDAGLIRGEISGPSSCYCLEKKGLAHFKKLVREF